MSSGSNDMDYEIYYQSHLNERGSIVRPNQKVNGLKKVNGDEIIYNKDRRHNTLKVIPPYMQKSGDKSDLQYSEFKPSFYVKGQIKGDDLDNEMNSSQYSSENNYAY